MMVTQYEAQMARTYQGDDEEMADMLKKLGKGRKVMTPRHAFLPHCCRSRVRSRYRPRSA